MLRIANLNPQSPLSYPEASSIAYLGGDLPGILLHVDDNTHFLAPGDCFPTDGKSIALENPFQRGGKDLSIGVNMPLTYGSALRFSFDSREGSTVTYYTAESIQNAGDDLGRKKAVAMIKKDGAARVEIKSDAPVDVSAYPGVGADFMDLLPAGVLSDPVRLNHPSGNRLETVDAHSGSFDNAGAAAWFDASAEASLGDVTVISKGITSITLTVEAGDMLFVSGAEDADLDVQIKVMDLGDVNGVAVV